MSTHQPTSSLVVVLAAFLSVGTTLAQDGPAYLVKDLAATPNAAAGLRPYGLTVHDDQLYFVGWHPLTGNELWTSDGTAEGTRLVADTAAGNGSDYGGVRSPLVPLGDAVYFASCDEVSVCQLWRSDGTSAGTVPITRFSSRSAGVSLLTAWNGTLYFVAADARHSELHRSDGTAEGTELVADIVMGPGDSGLRDLAVAANRLFLSFGDRLWTSDGTAAGTRHLLSLGTSWIVSPILEAGSRIFFVVGFFEVWTSDGTPSGTRRIVTNNGAINPLATFSGKLFFSTLNELGEHNLWISDGTPSGTRMVNGLPSRPLAGVALGGELYFGVGGQLWKTDGSTQGTVRVADLEGSIRSATVLGDTLFVGTTSGLWKMDDDGVTLVDDAFSASELTPFREGVAFQAESPETGSELAVTSGGGAALLTDVVDPGSSRPAELTAHQGTLLFSTSRYPAELYQTRGTADQTRGLGSFDSQPVSVRAGERAFVLEDDLRVLDPDGELVPLLEGQAWEWDLSLLRDAATAFEDQLSFLVWNFATDHIELWRSNGTGEGTRRIGELMEFHYCFVCSPPEPWPTYGIVPAGDRLFVHFANHLWTTDGSVGGAVELDLSAGCDGCDLDRATRVGDRLFFTTSRYAGMRRLWTSDGTEEGTRVVREFASPTPEGRPARVGDFLALGPTLVFVIEDPALGEELWTSDGTAAGTVPVRDIRPGPGSSNPRAFAVVGGRLDFAADDGIHGHELWTSDGTLAGTHLAADLRPGAMSSSPRELTAVDGRLVFAADDGVHGLELWTSDGSAAGTRLLQDLQPGPLPSSPHAFTAAGERVYFAAGTEDTGIELWALPGGEACEDCLLDGRFEVSVTWYDDQGGERAGRPVFFSDETVLVWFFHPSNIELLVKVLDGRAMNGHFWVFYGALTHLEYRIRVEDRLTGAVRTYHNPPGNLCGQGDVRAFRGQGEAWAGRAAARRGALEPAAHQARETDPCVPGSRTLCLHDGRFRIGVEWTNQHADGAAGWGRAIPGTDETGYFWFFDEGNVELAVKVLDGQAINGRFWFFYGALTDVEYRLTVTDSQTGARRPYHNPPGEICGRGDVGALEPY